MFVKPSSAPVAKPSLVASSSGRAKNARYARLLPSTRKSSHSRAGASSSSSSAPVTVFGDIAQRYRPDPMRRVPLLYGSRLVVADAGDDAVVIAPPPPPERIIADVGAAVRDALRFPLAGEPLETLVPRGGRVTIVVEPPGLPVPGSSPDPRQAALAAASDELERIGVPTDRQTILLAGGLSRRAGRRVLESLATPEFALRFRGDVV